MIDTETVAEMPAPVESDAFTARVLELLREDQRTAPLIPVVETLIVSLGPMFGVDQTAGETTAPSGVGDVFAAVHDAVLRTRQEEVHAYHQLRGDQAIDPAAEGPNV